MSPHFLLTGPGGHCRLHADAPDALYAAFALALPPRFRARMSDAVERALIDGLRACPERGEWRYGGWSLLRIEGEG